MPFISHTNSDKLLVADDYVDAAVYLNVDVASIKAVSQVETSGSGFLSDGSLKLLFEGHIFYRYTSGKYAASSPDICYQQWTTKFYARGANADERGHGEQERLARAMKLDKKAAIMSISMGRFQVMGFNAALCGYKDVEAFYSDMLTDETNHLEAFVDYVTHTGLDDALRTQDWATFARRYNGPEYKKNDYDGKLAKAYASFKQNAGL